jgi:hypothetical protein
MLRPHSWIGSHDPTANRTPLTRKARAPTANPPAADDEEERRLDTVSGLR